MKKILVIDDSALMRRVISDIIDSTNEYKVEYTASNGVEGLAILEKHSDITAAITDINMPRMNGLEFLHAVNDKQITVPIIVFSSSDDAKETITALELGAIEFIKKPEFFTNKNNSMFQERVLRTLKAASHSKEKEDKKDKKVLPQETEKLKPKTVSRPAYEVSTSTRSNKLVAIASSTGGPKALQSVVSRLPRNLAAPVIVVQHMPAGFTKSLATRLDEIGEIRVKEAEDGEKLQNGVVYIAKGGTHLTIEDEGRAAKIRFDDSPPVVGLKPCGNIMYNSLCHTSFDEIICVVLTGMGSDGTKGIQELSKSGKIHVIAQDEASSTVYGMPRAVYEQGLVNVVCDIHKIADEIVKKTGVK